MPRNLVLIVLTLGLLGSTARAADVRAWTYDGLEANDGRTVVSASGQFEDDELVVRFSPEQTQWQLVFTNRSSTPIRNVLSLTTLDSFSQPIRTLSIDCAATSCVRSAQHADGYESTATVPLPPDFLESIERAKNLDISYYAGDEGQSELHWYRFPMLEAGAAVSRIRTELLGMTAPAAETAEAAAPVDDAQPKPAWTGLSLDDVRRCAKRSIGIEQQAQAAQTELAEIKRLEQQIQSLRRVLDKEHKWVRTHGSTRAPDVGHYNAKAVKLQQLTIEARGRSESYEQASKTVQAHKSLYDRDCFAPVRPDDLRAVCAPGRPGAASPWCKSFEVAVSMKPAKKP